MSIPSPKLNLGKGIGIHWSQLIGKDSDAGRDWGQEEKGTTEDEIAGCHHRLDGHESEWTLEVGDGQGGLACCNSWGRKKSDMTEWLNWTELMSSASIQKLFCGIYSVFKCSFDEFVGEKVVSPSYSSTILGQLLILYFWKEKNMSHQATTENWVNLFKLTNEC